MNKFRENSEKFVVFKDNLLRNWGVTAVIFGKFLRHFEIIEKCSWNLGKISGFLKKHYRIMGWFQINSKKMLKKQ